MSRRTHLVLLNIEAERRRQDAKWGIQSLPYGTDETYEATARFFQRQNDVQYEHGQSNWTSVLLEEVYEALSETEPERLREELVQVAAVAVAWVEHIDRCAR